MLCNWDGNSTWDLSKEKGKRNLDSGLSLKSYGQPPPHLQLLSMKEVCNNKTSLWSLMEHEKHSLIFKND